VNIGFRVVHETSCQENWQRGRSGGRGPGSLSVCVKILGETAIGKKKMGGEGRKLNSGEKGGRTPIPVTTVEEKAEKERSEDNKKRKGRRELLVGTAFAPKKKIFLSELLLLRGKGARTKRGKDSEGQLKAGTTS